MPKIVDYAAHFKFLHEAAFAVTLDDGPGRLSRQALADTLGTSLTTVRRLLAADASLPGLAARAVRQRRSHGRWGLPSGADREQNAIRLLASLLPCTEERIDEEVVWLKLVLHHPSPEPRCARALVRESYQLFDRDWADEETTGPTGPTRGDDGVVARHIAERETHVRVRLLRVLDELAVEERERPSVLVILRTFVDGLTWAVCQRHLTPGECMEQVEALVHRLSRVEG